MTCCKRCGLREAVSNRILTGASVLMGRGIALGLLSDSETAR